MVFAENEPKSLFKKKPIVNETTLFQFTAQIENILLKTMLLRNNSLLICIQKGDHQGQRTNSIKTVELSLRFHHARP